MSIEKNDKKMKFSFQNKVVFLRKDAKGIQQTYSFFLLKLLTINREERKLPIKALKERATGTRLSETRRLVQAVGRARQL